MKNIEIEIKVRISDDTASHCKDFLASNATFINSSREIDQYLSPSHRNFLAPEFPYEWLRLRQKSHKVILNYKHWYPENEQVSTHCDEFESEIGNVDSFLKIMHAIGVTPLIVVDKIREKYNYDNDFEVSLDYIEELGYFVEIEYTGDSQSIEEANKELTKMAGLLMLNLNDRDNRGYPYLMLEKMGQLKK